jgi:hypothetical protein
MKYFVLVFTLMMKASYSFASHQDIIIKSHFDMDSSSTLIGRLRTFLINNKFGDPYNQHFAKPFVTDLNQVLEDLPNDSRAWIKDLQAILNLKLFDSSYKLVIESFSYSIDNFSAGLSIQDAALNRIDYVTHNYVNGLKLKADKISFNIELQRTYSGEPIRFSIDLLGVNFLVDPSVMAELPMGWQTILMPDYVLLSLNLIDLSKILFKITQRPELVSLLVEDVLIPEVSIKVGNKELRFDKDKIKQLINDRRNELKTAVLDVLKVRMSERFENIIKDAPQELAVKRTMITQGNVRAIFHLQEMNADKKNEIMEMHFRGNFCNDKLSAENCDNHHLPARIRRIVSLDDFNRSVELIDNLFKEKKANLVLSISEHYLNKTIMAAVHSGILDLGSAGLTLGPEKLFILAEEAGDDFLLYLDIIHLLPRSQRRLLGRSELRFPVRLGIDIKIILKSGFPHLQIRVSRIATDEQLLLAGAPAYGLPTTVDTVRLRKRVLESIMEDVNSFRGKVLAEIDLKEFKDTYLEDLSFFSDGFGRATAVMSINH